MTPHFDLARWLADIGLPQYAEIFVGQGFDELGLTALDDADLRELGISAMGHRKIILREAARLTQSVPAALLPADPLGQPPHLAAIRERAAAAEAVPALAPAPRGRVFLSYGHDPACVEIVHRIMGDLRDAGWDPWVDSQGIRFGDDWRREITKGIQDSQHVLAFLSQHSTRKPGVCRQEVAIALGPRKGHVYTVLVESLERVNPPLIVSHLQWLDMQQWQELKEKDPPAYEALYRKSLQEILRVLERNEPFAGDIELLQRWLDPLDGTADMLAAEEGFTGRRWLLDGLVEQPVWKAAQDDQAQVGLEPEGFADDRQSDEAAPDALIGEIERWRTSGSSNRVFWLSAGPGWGKSAVAARLAHAARPRVMAVHYCRYNKPGTRDARQVVRTLAFQMATQLGDYRELLVRQAKQGTPLGELNAQELFDKLLANPLAHELGGGRSADDRHLIVLDALDETLENEQSELLNLVAGEFGKLPPWLGLVVTSRPEAPVKRQLGAFGVQHQEENDPRNLEDLRAYVRAWLQGMDLQPAQRDRALSAVVQASEGMFLYVRQLREAVTSGAVPASQLTDPARLPKGLAGLYERWFQSRFNGDRGQQAYDQWQRPLLELMLAAREPLPLVLANAVLGWGAYGEAHALEPLGTLCAQQAGAVSLFHKSLADWLANADVSGRRFHASPAQGHQRLAAGLWAAYMQWREAGASFTSDAGWQALGEAGDAYAMRHLSSHLMTAGRDEHRVEVLTDFALALRRCREGAVEEMLDDYRDERGSRPLTQLLGSWAECVVRQSHLLRRGTPRWQAHRILLQIAVEEADNAAITRAAEAWLQHGDCDWVWVRNRARPVSQVKDTLLALLEGHTAAITGAQVLDDGRILSWSWDKTLRLWDGYSGAALAIMEGHSGEVSGAVITPNGRVLSWSHDNTLRLWDGLSGAPLAVMEGHSGPVKGAFVLPNGQLISWAAEARYMVELGKGAAFSLRLWNGQNGMPLDELIGHSQIILGALALSDGRVISWSGDRTLRLWDVNARETISVLVGHSLAVKGAHPLPDGRLLSWSGDCTLRIWDLEAAACVAILEGHTRSVSGAQLLPNGRVLSWSDDGTLRIWDSRIGAPLTLMTGHTSAVDGAQLLTDGRLISWSRDTTLRLWESQTGNCVALLKGHLSSVNGAQVIPDGRLLSWAGNSLFVWHEQEGINLSVMTSHTERVRGVQIDRGGRLLSWSDDCRLRLWDLTSVVSQTASQRRSRSIAEAHVLDDGQVLCLSMDGGLYLSNLNTGVESEWAGAQLQNELILGVRGLSDDRVLSYSEDGTLRIHDGYTGATLAVMEGHKGPVQGVEILPDGRVLSWSQDGTLRVWHGHSGVALAVLDGHTGGVEDARVLSDGRVLSWSWARTFRLWDLTSGAVLAELEAYRGRGSSVQVMNDGLVLWCYEDGTLRLWNPQRCASPVVMQGHTDRVVSAQVLPDGRVISCSFDNTVRVWDGKSGAPVAVMEGHKRPVAGARVLPDGRVLSWGYDNTLRLWDGRTGASLAVMEGHYHIEGVRVLPEGKVLSWCSRGDLRVWDTGDGSLLSVLQGHEDRIDRVVVLSKNQLLLSSDDGTLRLWDPLSGTLVLTYEDPWVINAAHPTPWDSFDGTLSDARKIGRVWTQATDRGVVVADQSGEWSCVWHSSGASNFVGRCSQSLYYLSGRNSVEVASKGAPLEGRNLLALQLMNGRVPLGLGN